LTYLPPSDNLQAPPLLNSQQRAGHSLKKLARTLCTYLDGVLAYCRHKVPFGVVEAINGNLRALIRRGRGYRDHQYLILKAQKSSAQARFATAA
jgi:transposase